MPDPAAEDPRPVGRRTPVVGGAFVLSALLALAGTTLILGLGATAEPPPRHILAVVTFLLDLTLVTAVVCGFGYAVTGYASGIAMSSWNDLQPVEIAHGTTDDCRRLRPADDHQNPLARLFRHSCPAARHRDPRRIARGNGDRGIHDGDGPGKF